MTVALDHIDLPYEPAVVQSYPQGVAGKAGPALDKEVSEPIKAEWTMPPQDHVDNDDGDTLFADIASYPIFEDEDPAVLAEEEALRTAQLAPIMPAVTFVPQRGAMWFNEAPEVLPRPGATGLNESPAVLVQPGALWLHESPSVVPQPVDLWLDKSPAAQPRAGDLERAMYERHATTMELLPIPNALGAFPSTSDTEGLTLRQEILRQVVLGDEDGHVIVCIGPKNKDDAIIEDMFAKLQPHG